MDTYHATERFAHATDNSLIASFAIEKSGIVRHCLLTALRRRKVYPQLGAG